MATAAEHATTAGVQPAAGRAPLPIAATVAALWAATVSYAPLGALAAAGSVGSGSTPGGAARLALAGWLLSHGVPLQTPSDHVSLIPLTVTALVVWRLARAGIHASRAYRGHRGRSLGRPLIAATAVAAVYGAVGFVAAVVVDSPGLTVHPMRAAVTLSAVAVVAAGLGAAGHSRAWRHWVRRVPIWVSGAVRAGLGTAVLIVAGGAAVAGVALALQGGEAAEMLGSYRVGILGQAGITAVCLAYAPNAAVWGAAYLLGPGFAVGTDTVVSPADVLIGPVPAVPAFAGVPAQPLTGIGSALLAVPVVAAVFIGWLTGRRMRASTWSRVLAAGVLAGPVAGLAVHLAAVASAGALGSARLAFVGPSGPAAGIAAAATAAAGVTIAAQAARRLHRGH